MTFDEALRRIADGLPVTLHLSDVTPRQIMEPCPWCVKVRGAAVATMCEVACPGSTPMCALCLAMYDPCESDVETEAAIERAIERDRLVVAAGPPTSGAARSVGRFAKLAVYAVNAVASYWLIRGLFRALGITLLYVALVLGARAAMAVLP